MKDKKTYIILILVVVIILLGWFIYGKMTALKELQNLNSAANSELQVYKDKDGYNRGRIEVLETQNTKAFLAFETQDSIIKKLQESVEENKKYLKNYGSVTNSSIGTTINNTSPTEITYITNDSFPTYTSKFDMGGWVYGKSVANKDSTYLDIKVKNDFTLVIGEEKQGFLGLGKSKPFVDIKLENPYSEVESLRTYQVTPIKVKRWNIGPTGGLQYSDGSITPFIGVGVMYGLIQF